jgi:arylsulfatase
MIEAGRIDKRPAHIIDIMPTFIELAGGIYPDSLNGKPVKPMIGKSLVPVFKNINIEWERTLLWEHEGNRAVRKGDWKLVSRYDQDAGGFMPWELYNLAEDRTELNDFSSDLPDKTREMIELYEKLADEAEVTPWDEVLEIRKQNRR